MLMGTVFYQNTHSATPSICCSLIFYYSQMETCSLYLAQISSGFSQSTILMENNVIMKSDPTSGRILWAKSFTYLYQETFIGPYTVIINNDIVYWFILDYHISSYFVIISKVDQDGNLIKSFSFINDASKPKESFLFYFIPEFYLVRDEAIFIIGETSYNDAIGVSQSSQVDLTLFKFNNNFEIEWATSLDFRNQKEQASDLKEYEDAIYITFNSDLKYFCISSVENLSNGEITKSNWISVPSIKSTDGVGRFTTPLISNKYIFGIDSILFNKLNNSIFIFDRKTLNLSKILMSNLFYRSKSFVLNGDQYVFIKI